MARNACTPADTLQFLEPGHGRHIARGPQDADRAAAGIAQQRLPDMAAHQHAVLPLQARLAGPLALGPYLAQRGEVVPLATSSREYSSETGRPTATSAP